MAMAIIDLAWGNVIRDSSFFLNPTPQNPIHIQAPDG